jgi:TonB-linked SusC/RagA family outer membrane protein
MRHKWLVLAATVTMWLFPPLFAGPSGLSPAVAEAQQMVTIRGRVMEVPGQRALSGAQVTIPAIGAGVLTNASGVFVLSVPPGTYEVVVSALGHRTDRQQVTVATGQTQTINFELPVSAIELDEIVASVGAGEVTRREIGVDIASVDVENAMDRAVVSNLSELLSARAGNLQIQQGSGNVGAASRIRIRGINSLTQDNNPLIIIDGVRASNDTGVGINRGQTFSRLDDINPEDIARVQVVKGPAATALYGSEAAPGVIIIETKKGQSAQSGLQATFSYEQSVMRDVTDFPDNLADVTPFVTGPDDPRLSGFRVDTNPVTGQVFVRDNPFEDEDSSPFRTGYGSEARVSVSGRGEGVSYYTSVGYDNSTGALPSNDLERLNFRGNFLASPSDKIRLSASAGYVSSEINLPKSGNNTSGYFANALAGIPQSSFGADGTCLATALAGVDRDFCARRNGNIRATFDKIIPITSREDLERFTASIQANYKPVAWLTNEAKIGTDVVSQEFTDAIPFDPDVPFSFAAGGENFITRNLIRNTTADLSSTAQYGLREGLRASTTVGAQYFNDRLDAIACEGRVFVNDQATACDAGVSLRGFSDLREKVEIGAYAQQRFDYNDYFFLTGALRVDDNSALGVEEGAIWSPSFNTSLVLSDMPFWGIERDVLTSLRVRGAWGLASQSPAQFAAERTFGTVRLARDGQIVLGLTPQDVGNPNLGPERSEEFEIGLNAGFWEDRIGVGFTYFDRTTTDAIVRRPVAPSTGFGGVQFVNLGELSNSGFEFDVNALVLDTENASWTVGVIASATDPIITKLGFDTPVPLGFSQWLVEGFAPGAYFTRRVVSAERDASGAIVPGSIVYAEGDDIGDGRGLVFSGTSIPTNEQSLTSSLTLFGDLRISTLFARSAGNHVFSSFLSARNPGRLSGVQSRMDEFFAFRQTRATPVEQAAMELDDRVGNHDQHFIQPADFIKWREFKISYDLSGELARRFGGPATVYVGARNLATWTDFPGLDPEANTYGARDNLTRSEGFALPPARTLFTGIRMSF